jgi:hypothetical protein
MADEFTKLFSTRSERYPEPTGADAALGVSRAALAAIPIVGGSITEVVSMVLAPSIGRRRDEWLKELADGLDEVERKVEGFKIENLGQDENFVSAVIEASRSAVSTHKSEKRVALRNALLNIALHRGPEEDQQQMFLRYIDEFTIWHVRILALFRDPPKYLAAKSVRPNYYMGGGSQVLEDVYPELKGQRELYDQISSDLNARGLFNSPHFLHTTMSAQGMVSKRTTPLADRFLDFITSPVD